MAVPTDVVWGRDPHTEAKHQILRCYLDAYFPIMAGRWASTGISFVDAFAGPGEYSDGSAGSPILALRATRRAAVQESHTQIHLIFVEKEPDRYEHLIELLNGETVPSYCHVTTKKGRCEKVLIPALDQMGLWGGPMFVNFDGWGVDTPLDMVRRVGQGKAPEVLVTFHSQWFERFAGEEDVSAGDRVFGDRRWRAVKGCRTPADKKRFLVAQYRERLVDCNFQFQLTFELVDEGGHPLLLVFGTNNQLGIEKMKDAMWRVDREFGSRFRDPRDPNQLEFDLSDADPNLVLLRQQLLERIAARNDHPCRAPKIHPP